MRHPTRSLWPLAALVLLSCHAREPKPVVRSLRLVDLYKPAMVHGTVPLEAPPPRTEWRFDQAGTTHAWHAGHGVSGLAVREGKLAGRTTGPISILHTERTPLAADKDLLHAIEVRLRASAGSRLQVSFSSAEKVNVPESLAGAEADFWYASTPLVAGDEWRTYTLTSRFPVTAAETRHVLLWPTEAAGATFELESVRLVFRREHLASVASGVGWQGLAGVYRETLVARAPETIRFPVEAPRGARLELELGTIEQGPVTFRVTAGSAGKETVLLERTVTSPHRWETVSLDLSAAKRRVDSIALQVVADKPGTVGFWGAPALRNPGPPARSATAADPPQGVIVIWADTLRRDHLGAYGYKRPTSPHLDRLAQEGALFRDCVSQGTWTKVSTSSLMTSLYPTSHGVKDFSDRVPSSATTLAEVYRSAGYATLSMSSILFTGRFTNLHQGFETVWEDSSLTDRMSSKTAREYVDRLLPWLDAHADVPFFVFLHVADPHDPFRPAPPYDTLFADPSRAAAHEEAGKKVRASITDPLLKIFGMPTRAELEKAGLDAEDYVAQDRDWYDGSIRGMDAEVGRLIQRLDARGLRGKVLVAFAGDHGEEFLEHGRTFHGQSVYGELANVPLILWRPGQIPAGTVVDETVSIMDVMPTLLQMGGLASPPETQGRSLAAALLKSPGAGTVRADASAPRPAITEKAVTTEKGGPPPRDTASVALVSDGWKLVHHLQRAADSPELQLFEHRPDPLDARDVAGAHPEVVARLRRELAAWRSLAEKGRLKPDAEAAKALTPEEMERLRSLGYLQ